MATVDIVGRLKAAADAYYNGKPLLMDDDAYDSLVDNLRSTDPKHPFLETIGAPPLIGATALPYPMPSLDKVKPGQDSLARFLRNDPLLLMEKLDGLSALWIPESKRLYLRGDGRVGQDISHLVRLGIQGLLPASGARTAIRGELVVAREGMALSRSWVNGIIHQKTPPPTDVRRIRFVAYDLLEPATLTRSQALNWLLNKGYEVPWHTITAATEEMLKATLLERRTSSSYDTDGIVVAMDAIPARPAAGKNPKDMMAFKMPLSDQSATTTLQEVLWAPSAQGYLVPRLRFDPITVGGATIEFCTAHNARTVVEKGLGPGAQIRVRRSGDVIPTLDTVLLPATASLPTGDWEWAGPVETAIHIRTLTVSPKQVAAKLQHFFSTLDIPSMGPANCEALVAASLVGPASLWAATEDRLTTMLGPKTGAALYKALREKLPAVKELTLMIASSAMPRGVGEAKLTALFGACADWKQWRTLERPPAGWTATSLKAFQEALGTYETWRTTELSWLVPEGPVVSAVVPADKGTLCFTGFRDKALEAMATAAGFRLSSTLTSKVTVLVMADGKPETEKIKKAAGRVELLSRSAFIAKYLNQG